MAYPTSKQRKYKKIKSKLKFIVVMILIGCFAYFIVGNNEGNNPLSEMKAKASSTGCNIKEDVKGEGSTDLSLEKKGDSISLRWGKSAE